jgi:hypothetical protein
MGRPLMPLPDGISVSPYRDSNQAVKQRLLTGSAEPECSGSVLIFKVNSPMGNRGYVKLYRQIQENPLWLADRFSRGQAWVDLLLMANYEDSKVIRGTVIPVLRGQVFTSQIALANRWRWDRKTVHSFLKLLEEDNMLNIQTSKQTDTGYTLLTIKNYELYQSSSQSALDIQNGSGLDIETDIQSPSSPHRIPTSKKNNKKKNKEEPAECVFSLDAYLSKFSSQDQVVIRKTISAISSTRKSGRMTPAVMNRIAASLSEFQDQTVVQACRIYLQGGHANDGKNELYLLGIARKLNHPRPGVSAAQAEPSTFKTEGSMAIKMAMAKHQKENQDGISE